MAQTTYFASKPRYAILDGLRGVAALMVVAFHLFETYIPVLHTQVINHGYLAVDFFFILSGFVIGYAYDDRWAKGMTVGNFFKRRLIRLQPMVIAGTIFGTLMFLFGIDAFRGMTMSWWKILLAAILGCCMIPLLPGLDIRGWQEMYPLNGPQWSLFLEYIGNILYATIIHKFSKKWLSVFVGIAAAILIEYAVTCPTGSLAGGWSLNWAQLRIGFTRLLFPFFGGLLLYRFKRLIHVKHAFLWCSLLIILFLCVPRLGSFQNHWINGLYEALVIIFVFPVIVSMGAGGETKPGMSTKICNFLGEISYPIYITHYPLIYAQMAWAAAHKEAPVTTQIFFNVSVYILAILLAYACLKLYDLPVREKLKEKFLAKPKTLEQAA